jgi:LytS/YehU family sensor histidine kinase
MYFSYTSLIVFPLITYLLWWEGAQIHTWLEKHYSWQVIPVKRFAAQFLLFAVTGIGTVMPMYIADKSWRIYKGYEIDTIGIYHVTVMGTLVLLAVAIVFTAQLSLYFIQQWVSSQVEAEQFKKESMEAKFESLKNQISPHFLFNSMNILSELVDQDTVVAKQYIDKLSDVYRYVLQNRHNELILLEKELEFAQAYIFLLQKRFGDNLQVVFEVASEQKIKYLPPLTLQLLLENAVKHNIVSRKKPLIIQVMSEQGDNLTISNNLQIRIDNTLNSTGIGLENLRKRYEYLADTQPIVTKTAHSFKVKVPLLTISQRFTDAPKITSIV